VALAVAGCRRLPVRKQDTLCCPDFPLAVLAVSDRTFCRGKDTHKKQETRIKSQDRREKNKELTIKSQEEKERLRINIQKEKNAAS